MKIRYVLIVIFLLVVGVFLGAFVMGDFLTGGVIRDFDEYSYTRAICSGEECIDAVVSCKDGDVVEIEPIFYLVEHEDGWGDPRGEDFSGFCE